MKRTCLPESSRIVPLPLLPPPPPPRGRDKGRGLGEEWKPINKQEIAAFNLLTASAKNEDDMEKIFTRPPLWYCLRITGLPQLQH